MKQALGQSVMDRWEFPYLFRAFRLSIIPAKLVLGLLVIGLIYLGGLGLDRFWGPQVFPGEIERSLRMTSLELQQQRRERRELLRCELVNDLMTLELPEAEIQRLSQAPREAQQVLRERMLKSAQEELAWSRTQGSAEWEQARVRICQRTMTRLAHLDGVVPKGIFEAFGDFQQTQVQALGENLLSLVRLRPLASRPSEQWPVSLDTAMGSSLLPGSWSPQQDEFFQPDRVVGNLANLFYTAPRWLWTAAAPLRPGEAGESVWQVGLRRGLFWLYLVLWWGVSWVALSLLGGVLCLMGATEFTGRSHDLLEVLAQVWRRRAALIGAPLLMPLFGLVIFVLLALLGLPGAIPRVGIYYLILIIPIAWVGGLVLLLVALGVLGSTHLLWPASVLDATDAAETASRCGSYAYNSPWRTGFYGLTSLVYGAITGGFVALVLKLLEALTRGGVGGFSSRMTWDPIWQRGELERLLDLRVGFAAQLLQGEWLIFPGLWWAWAVGFFFASSTISYLLLRRAVDGPHLDAQSAKAQTRP